MPTIQETFSILREQRAEQVRMAELIHVCIETRQNATIEAGTGTGKSFAYLIPIVSQNKRAIISTGTIALQEQLIHQDLPWLKNAMAQSFNINFTYAMLKGASNYLCKRDFDEALGSLPEAVEKWAQTTLTGDLGEAPEMSAREKETIRIDLDSCSRQKCPWFEDCHHQTAKKRAKNVDVLVVVHAMTTMGLGQPYGLDFAGYDALIVDEAHQFEDYARGSFEGRLSPNALRNLFKSIESNLFCDPSDGSIKKMAEFYEKNIVELTGSINAYHLDMANRPDGYYPPEWVLTKFKSDVDGLKEAESSLESLRENMSERSKNWEAIRDVFRKAWREVILPWTPITHTNGEPFTDEKLLVDVGWIRESSKPAAEALVVMSEFVVAHLIESDTSHQKIKRQLENVNGFFDALSSGDVIAVAERKIKEDDKFASVTMVTFPLDLGPRLIEGLYPMLPVIYTSATISSGGDFSLIKNSLGLKPEDPETEIGSPFNYPGQAALYIPNDSRFDGSVPLVHGPAVREEVETLLKASQGDAFVLFTSNKNMREAYERRRHGFPCRWQDPDSNKNALIKWFKETPGAVLYATASFWEGVSIEGEKLRLVIIDKIPFPPPSDPIYKAKEARMSGGKAFFVLSIPIAILKLKQGFGRLIRTKDDHGIVAVLDSRIHGKGYGRKILAALPKACLITDLSDRGMVKLFLDERPGVEPIPAAVEVIPAAVDPEPEIDPRLTVKQSENGDVEVRLNSATQPAITISIVPEAQEWEAQMAVWEASF